MAPITRRSFVPMLALAGTPLLSAPFAVQAQSPWPARPVKLVVPQGAG